MGKAYCKINSLCHDKLQLNDHSQRTVLNNGTLPTFATSLKIGKQ